jgi:hypothetical protein
MNAPKSKLILATELIAGTNTGLECARVQGITIKQVTFTPERWKQISDAFFSLLSLAQSPKGRPAYKCVRCGSDTVFEGRLIHYTDCEGTS